MNRHQVSVSAESFTAGALAQAGYCVFVQYGANQPGFDLMASDMESSLMISVKGSTNGGWILTAKDSSGTYESALDAWLVRNARMIFCLVQFQDVKVREIPRMYLVSGETLGAHLRTNYFGGGVSLTLWEKYKPQRGKNKGKSIGVDTSWLVSHERIDAIFKKNSKASLTNS